jgi:DNA-binding transcriptional regulator of glucitol operon
MVDNLFWIFLLIAGMWAFQLYLAVKQSQRFGEQIKEIRTAGTTTSVGIGGYRYRGGRAFVAIAQKDGIVTGSRVLTGLSVFANSKPWDKVIGMHISDLAEGKGLENEKRKRRDGAKSAAQTLLEQNSQT